MFPLPALPLPKIHRGIDVYHAKTFCRVFGLALLVQWFLPWGGPLWSWNVFGGTLWSLLAGAGLTALSFINSSALKLGHYYYAAAGAGTIGILYTFASEMALWPFNPMGMIGIAGVGIASFYWLRNGYSQIVFIMMIVGLAGLALGLLIPSPFTGLPLIFIFRALGVLPIVSGIFLMVLSLAYLALIVNWVLQVFLKKDNADPEQVERHALVLFFFPFVAMFLVGLFSFFPLFATMLHNIVIYGSYLWLAIWGVVTLLELKQNDGLKDLMQTPV